jgi:hypothetical protein
MSEQLIQDPNPWTTEEDAVLLSCWDDPDIDFVEIAKLIQGFRTRTAIQRRGYELGLGRKAQHEKPRKTKKKLEPWPEDMPKFEDHPHATESRSWTRAAMLGSRLKTKHQNEDASLTGSSLEGASPQGLKIED